MTTTAPITGRTRSSKVVHNLTSADPRNRQAECASGTISTGSRRASYFQITGEAVTCIKCQKA